jgi:hypothetical protein
MTIVDGIAMFGRLSIGWNFHRTRNVRTIALPLALSFVGGNDGGKRVLLVLGPVTFVWLR